MKLNSKLILTFVWLFPILLFAATPQKQTYTFTKQDSQSLYLDVYSAYTEEAQPCLVFMFGGGFKEGRRDADIPWYGHWYGQGYAYRDAGCYASHDRHC